MQIKCFVVVDFYHDIKEVRIKPFLVHLQCQSLPKQHKTQLSENPAVHIHKTNLLLLVAVFNFANKPPNPQALPRSKQNPNRLNRAIQLEPMERLNFVSLCNLRP